MKLSKYLLYAWVLGMGLALPAAVITVPGDFAAIQAAIDAAGTGDEIVVAAGTYAINSTIDFKGKAVTLRSASGNPADTILDGQNSVYHVVQCITDEGSDTVLSGFTITRGNANGTTVSTRSAGGMYNYSSSPTVTNCNFNRNSANDYGGGMYNNVRSNPVITNCTFNVNHSGQSGGGISNNSLSNPTLIQCTFSDNSGGWGGGMVNNSSNPTVTQCTFSGNSANNHGGGMYNFQSSPTIANCTFSGNSADNYGGGGIGNYASNLIVSNCSFSGNSAPNGGGMNNSDSSPTVINSILWGDIPQEINGGSTATYSNVQGGFAGDGNINADPLFVDANGADNIAGTEDDDLRLQNGSPCLDVGNNSAATQTTDIAGLPRFLDGNCDTTATVDMGAYEYSRRYQGDLNDDCGVNLPDVAILSAHWQSSATEADIAVSYGDGIVDMADLLVVASNWLSAW